LFCSSLYLCRVWSYCCDQCTMECIWKRIHHKCLTKSGLYTKTMCHIIFNAYVFHILNVYTACVYIHKSCISLLSVSSPIVVACKALVIISDGSNLIFCVEPISNWKLSKYYEPELNLTIKIVYLTKILKLRLLFYRIPYCNNIKTIVNSLIL